MDKIERFVCATYGYDMVCDVNELRYHLFCKSKNVQCHQLPPTNDALAKHVKRDNFKAKIWKNILQCITDDPSPNHHCWIVTGGLISIDWVS